MKNMQSDRMLHVAQALLDSGKWLTVIGAAEAAGIDKRASANWLGRMGEASRRWSGDEVFETRLVGERRKARQYRVRKISDDSSAKELVLKHFNRNPNLTLNELAQRAGCSASTAHLMRRAIVESATGIIKPRKNKPSSATLVSPEDEKAYAQSRLFGQIWPMRRAS